MNVTRTTTRMVSYSVSLSNTNQSIRRLDRTMKNLTISIANLERSLENLKASKRRVEGSLNSLKAKMWKSPKNLTASMSRLDRSLKKLNAEAELIDKSAVSNRDISSAQWKKLYPLLRSVNQKAKRFMGFFKKDPPYAYL